MENTITQKEDVRVKRKSQVIETAKRYMKNKLAVLGLLIFLVILFFALFAGKFGTYEESVAIDIVNKLKTPSSEHWFGTDTYGRDLFLRCIYGARISLIIGIVASLLSLLVGGLLGMTAAYYGGNYDNNAMRMLDIFSAIPTILLAICIVAALGDSTFNIILALAISRMPSFARIARASVLGVSGQEYVEAARAGGTGDMRILLRHVLPNMLGPIMVQTTTNVAQMILQIASLSFLGLGVPSPTPEWGAIITEAKGVMRMFPYMIWIPGICIMAASLSVNLIGDSLRDALDPRLKN
jgi:peptide/nickel transport system permease protein